MGGEQRYAVTKGNCDVTEVAVFLLREPGLVPYYRTCLDSPPDHSVGKMQLEKLTKLLVMKCMSECMLYLSNKFREVQQLKGK